MMPQSASLQKPLRVTAHSSELHVDRVLRNRTLALTPRLLHRHVSRSNRLTCFSTRNELQVSLPDTPALSPAPTTATANTAPPPPSSSSQSSTTQPSQLTAPLTAYKVKGTGKYLDIDVNWTYIWRADGAFCEEISSPSFDFSSSWGYDPTTETSWEVDSSGCSRQLSRDDHEGAALSAIIMSGAWKSESIGDDETKEKRSTAALQSVVNQPFDCLTYDTTDSDELGDDKLRLGMVLKEGKLRADVSFQLHTTDNNNKQWLPSSITLITASTPETTNFGTWNSQTIVTDTTTNSTSTVWYPSSIERDPGTGQLNVYKAHGVEVFIYDDTDTTAFYRMPHTPILPTDTTFLPNIPPTIPAWFTPSGHVLVQPLLNGQNVGLFILDTGASCFVIEPDVANKLKLSKFGALHVTGMTGHIASHFRTADSIQLGPLEMSNPVLVEMPCKGLARGTHEPVVGIIGHEIFRRAVIEMPPPPIYTIGSGGVGSKKKSVQYTEREKKRRLINSPEAAIASQLYTTNNNNNKASAAGVNGIVEYKIHVYNPEVFEQGGGMVDTLDVYDDIIDSVVPTMATSSSSGTTSLEVGNDMRSKLVTCAAAATTTTTPTTLLNEDCWLPLDMVCGLPHIQVGIQPHPDTIIKQPMLLMLDSGAGGVDLMLNTRGVSYLELDKADDGKNNGGGVTMIRGVGGDHSKSLKTARRKLHKIQLGVHSFNSVTVLCAAGDRPTTGGMELSHYGMGIVCGELIRRCRIVVDIPRQRIALLKEDGDKAVAVAA